MEGQTELCLQHSRRRITSMIPCQRASEETLDTSCCLLRGCWTCQDLLLPTLLAMEVNRNKPQRAEGWVRGALEGWRRRRSSRQWALWVREAGTSLLSGGLTCGFVKCLFHWCWFMLIQSVVADTSDSLQRFWLQHWLSSWPNPNNSPFKLFPSCHHLRTQNQDV